MVNYPGMTTVVKLKTNTKFKASKSPSPLNITWLIRKDFDARRDWGQKEKGTTEDEMAGWHHWLDGHESQWTLGVGDGQGGLACCDSWDRKNQTWLSDCTELNWRLPWCLSGKESTCQCRRCGFEPLGWEDSLEKEMATHSSTHAWEIPWTEESGGLVHGGHKRVGHDWATKEQHNHT